MALGTNVVTLNDDAWTALTTTEDNVIITPLSAGGAMIVVAGGPGDLNSELLGHIVSFNRTPILQLANLGANIVYARANVPVNQVKILVTAY